MTVFETERLRVREWTEDPRDVAHVHDMLSRWEVARWLGARPRALESEAEALEAIRRWRSRASPDQRYGIWAVETRTAEDAVGSILVVSLPGRDDQPTDDIEVGWHLHPDAWGHGYATEAARAALDREFAAGASEVFAVVREGNTRSVAVTRRLGMVPIGIQTRWYGGLPLDTFRATGPATAG
jgi:RimJ/RimL family protein N-acetyltransferase